MEKKIIQLPKENNKSAKPSEKKKREVVSHRDWDTDINITNAFEQIKNNTKEGGSNLVYKELTKKRSSYMSQDKKKKLYDENKFILLDEIIDKIIACDFKCFYCKKEVFILYENIREPLQWSLERINNAEGHNESNVEISCLHCNLHRKTMHYERYKFTKEMTLIKKG